MVRGIAMDVREFENRKQDHLRLSLDPSVQAAGQTGLEAIDLIHEALPEIDLSDVSLRAPALGLELATPFYVAGMTAGHSDALILNQRLAQACARRGWMFGVGSQRRELEAGNEGLDRWERLREHAPGLALVGNIGLSQLIHAPIERVLALIEASGACALAVHLNAHQEAIQPEGTPNFRGGLEAITRLARISHVPTVVKETGCGISPATVARLYQAGVRAVDVSGRGGTHWGRIEGARARNAEDFDRRGAAQTFADWGIPTARAVREARSVVQLAGQSRELWASGGVRSGLDAAKLIALGAHRVGYAQPALAAAMAGERQLEAWMARQEFELKLALFGTGSISPSVLREKDGTWVYRSSV